METEILKQAATQARGLAIDAVHKAGIGHLGLPLGCAEIGAVLFSEALSFNPDVPRWINRDRFVLSAGHGSMFLYGWLHLSGYDLPIEEIKNFRQLHSKTPGHPEFGETDGVECTTGPLGQGVGNAVGIAVSQKLSQQKFNTPGLAILDNHVICLAGDGCFQEGVAMEASAFAGHFGLDNLIIIYDSNDVTLDAQAGETQSEDTAKRYEAIGFDVCTIDGHDMAAVLKAVKDAKAADNGKPKLIIAKTEIGRGIKEVAGTWKAHGEGGAKYAESARASLGLPEETFFVSDEVKAHFAKQKAVKQAAYAEWEKTYSTWKAAKSELAELLEAAVSGKRPSAQECLAMIPEFPDDAKLATRAAGGKVLQPLAANLPLLTTGSADLFGSTKNYLEGQGDFTRDNNSGRNFRFGIREHAMGAITNGMVYDGIWIASGATFLTFSDYMRPALRLASLAKLPVFQIFTHDSVGVGEDGHGGLADQGQPVFLERVQPADLDLCPYAVRKFNAAEAAIRDALAEVGLGHTPDGDGSGLRQQAQDDRDVVGGQAPEGVFLGSDLAQVHPVGGNAEDLAEGSLGDQLLQPANSGMILQQVPDHEDPVVVAGHFLQLLPLADREGKGLLHIDVLARQQGLPGQFVMQDRRGRNRHLPDGRVVHDRLRIGFHGDFGVLSGQMFPQLVAWFANGMQGPQGAEIPGQVLAPVSASDERQAPFVASLRHACSP